MDGAIPVIKRPRCCILFPWHEFHHEHERPGVCELYVQNVSSGRQMIRHVVLLDSRHGENSVAGSAPPACERTRRIGSMEPACLPKCS